MIPAFLIWVYPHPRQVKAQEKKLTDLHNESVAQINEGIGFAKQQLGNTKVFGAGNLGNEGEIELVRWKEKLTEENKRYNDRITALRKFPLSTGEIIALASLYVALISLFVGDNYYRQQYPSIQTSTILVPQSKASTDKNKEVAPKKKVVPGKAKSKTST